MQGIVGVSSNKVGIAIPQVVANYQSSLASGIGKTDTSLTLVNGNDPNGTALNGYMCFTVDANTANSEFVCGTASSTSFTSVTRGVDPISPSVSRLTLEKTHPRGASVVLTNYPSIAVLSRILNGQETIPAKLTYDSGVASSSMTGLQDLVSKAYADNLSFSTAPNGSLVQKGIYQEATKAQTASSTASGSTGADLIVPNSYHSASSTATTTVPVTQTNGTLQPAFIDQTGNYTWTGSHSFASTTTFTASSTPVFNASTTFATTTTFSGPIIGANRSFFGDGSNGVVTISATTTLTGDKFYDTLTVNNGVSLITAGYKVFVKNTLTNNGVIHNNGGAGSSGTGGTAAAGGTLRGGTAGANGAGTLSGAGGGGAGVVAIFARNLINNGVISANGGIGGAATANSGGAVGSGSTAIDYAEGGAGGTGAAGGGNGGGAGGAITSSNGVIKIPAVAVIDGYNFIGKFVGGGSGGGSGGVAGGGASGGGGGGGGGTVWLFYSTATFTTETATAATGGAGFGGGGTGGTGTNGNVYKIQL